MKLKTVGIWQGLSLLLFSVQVTRQVLIPQWEAVAGFNPIRALDSKRTDIGWITPSGLAVTSQDAMDNWDLFSEPGCDIRSFGSIVGCDIRSPVVRDPSCFMSGQLRESLPTWEYILRGHGHKGLILDWLRHGVDITGWFKHYKGRFKGKVYDASIPPKIYFPNNASCKQNPQFVATELEERIRNGSLRVLGRFDSCLDWPVCILPLTLETSKPRLCHDERFLNLFIKDLPYRLDTLRELPRLVETGDFMVSTDDKSGYDHIHLSKESSRYFGVVFDGWVMEYTTLPFGFKGSCYVYHTVGQAVASFFRKLGIPNLCYIDDRLFIIRSNMVDSLRLDSLEMVVDLILTVLTRLGYTLSLNKCQLVPSRTTRYLGFVVDVNEMAFRIPDEKKEKFKQLRENMMACVRIDLKTLQRFSGKCASMILAVPGALLYTREVNAAISFCQRTGKMAQLTPELAEELNHWCFLDSWEGVMTWRKEYHQQVKIATDASKYAWAGVVLEGSVDKVEVRDYFEGEDIRPIHLKELEAVLKTLQGLGTSIRDSRVDLLVDNQAVIWVWKGQGSKSREMNVLLKVLFSLTIDLNIDLRMTYVPSKVNPADDGSRKLSASDARLAPVSWKLVEDAFGPHSVDLMALDSNVMVDCFGKSLKHFTPWPTVLSAGINVFAQDVDKEINPYCFPPFGMISPFLAFLREKRVRECTVVLPVTGEYPVWWSLIGGHVQSQIQIGKKGQVGCLYYPSKSGWALDSTGLKSDLVAFRLSYG